LYPKFPNGKLSWPEISYHQNKNNFNSTITTLAHPGTFPTIFNDDKNSMYVGWLSMLI
jgi:hypothetical protein